MNSSPAQWAPQLDSWTWFVAENRVWVMVIITVIGFVAPFLSGLGKYRTRPTPSVVIRSAAQALGFAAALVTVCALMHFSDLRWLTPRQRVAEHLNAPGGMFSFVKPIVGVVNSVASAPVEFRAIETSVHVAIGCALLALGAVLLAALTSRRARRADIRAIVREEIRKSAAT